MVSSRAPRGRGLAEAVGWASEGAGGEGGGAGARRRGREEGEGELLGPSATVKAGQGALERVRHTHKFGRKRRASALPRQGPPCLSYGLAYEGEGAKQHGREPRLVKALRDVAIGPELEPRGVRLVLLVVMVGVNVAQAQELPKARYVRQRDYDLEELSDLDAVPALQLGNELLEGYQAPGPVVPPPIACPSP
jgi:hypothetical protein